MKKYCSVFYFEGRINLTENVVSLARVLAEQNYEVTFYCRKNPFIISENDEMPDDFPAARIYFDRPKDSFLGKKIWKWLAELNLDSLLPLLDAVLFFLQIKWHQFKKARAAKREMELIIGIDINGLVLLLFESWLSGNKNTIFLSLELRREVIFKKFEKIRLFLSRAAYRRVKCVLVQDEDRFKSLGKFNKFQHPTVFYLPNSPFKLDRNEVCDDNYFRRLFNLDEKKYPLIVAQTGMLNDKVYAKEIAAAFNFIDSGCALIFHERQKRDSEDEYLRELRQLNSRNLFLSLNPVPYKDLDKIYSAIGIGAAFYKDINENFAQISKASGKLAQYLRHGKPVLMNDLDSLRNLNERYKFGVTIKNPSDPRELKKALDEIIENYEFYSANASVCFEKEFDFRVKAATFLEFVENIENSNQDK